MLDRRAIAVQIALYFSSRRLERLLTCLRAQTCKNFDLYFYENSADPAEAERVRSILSGSGFDYHLSVGERNLGFTAHNELFSEHDLPYTLILNDDVWVSPDYVERLLALLETDSLCAAATGLILRWNGIGEPCASRDAQIDSAGLEYDCLGRVADRFSGVEFGHIESHLHLGRVFGVSCPAALFRSEAIEAVSPDKLPFDRTFFMYKEDVDLAIRLCRRGYQAMFDPAAIAFHERTVKDGSRSWKDRIMDERGRPLKLREQTYQNQWALYFYHWSFRLGIVDLAKTFWYEAKRSAALFFFGSPFAFFRAWKKILQSRAYAFRHRHQLREIGLPFIYLRTFTEVEMNEPIAVREKIKL
ncbi:MAG TPA: glycosyltransferase family 2 protein [Patescibacteria group bacterium]|nr:glycosyltransferase family 2 protein [Patescibacteria group bacterium]